MTIAMAALDKVYYPHHEDRSCMEFYEIIQSIAIRSKTSLEQVSLKFGKTANYISSQKSRGSSPKVDTAAKLVSTLGYTLCAIPKDSIPEGTYVVNAPENEE